MLSAARSAADDVIQPRSVPDDVIIPRSMNDDVSVARCVPDDINTSNSSYDTTEAKKSPSSDDVTNLRGVANDGQVTHDVTHQLIRDVTPQKLLEKTFQPDFTPGLCRGSGGPGS